MNDASLSATMLTRKLTHQSSGFLKKRLAYNNEAVITILPLLAVYPEAPYSFESL